MANFTGRARRIGNATNFGLDVDNIYPKAIVGNATDLYMFATVETDGTTTHGMYRLDKQTGVATLVFNDSDIEHVISATLHGSTIYVVTNDSSTGFVEWSYLHSVSLTRRRINRGNRIINQSVSRTTDNIASDGTTMYGHTVTDNIHSIDVGNFSTRILVSLSRISNTRGLAHDGEDLYMLSLGAGTRVDSLYKIDPSDFTLEVVGTPVDGFGADATNMVKLTWDGTRLFGLDVTLGDPALYEFLQEPPALSTPFPTDESVDEGQTYTRDFSDNFSENPTSYTVGTVSPASPALTADITDEGVLSATAPFVREDTAYTIPITASNILGSASGDFSLTVDDVPIIATFRNSDIPSQVRESFILGLSFSIDVQGLTVADFTVSGRMAINRVDGAGSNWFITLTPPSNSEGVGFISLSAHSINGVAPNQQLDGPATSVSSGVINYNTIRSTIPIPEPEIPTTPEIPVPSLPVGTLRDLSYRNLPISYEVYIALPDNNVIDITEFVQSVAGIDESLDLDIISEWTVNNATIVLNNIDNIFSSQDGNFFDSNMLPQSGFNVPVHIRLGFQDASGDIQDRVVFTGSIISSDEDVNQSMVTLRLGDISKPLYDNDVVDFGITKHGRLSEDQMETRQGITGSYPFSKMIQPVSLESVSGTSGANALVYKQDFDTEGTLTPLNFNYDERGLLTEGGPLNVLPVVELKAPYRYKRIDFIFQEILDHYNIMNRNINIPTQRVAKHHFSSLGRIGYEIENSDASDTSEMDWTGVGTDWIYHNNKYYILYSHRQYQTIPRIIEYNPAIDTKRLAYTHILHAEFWELAADGDDLFILGTSGSDGRNDDAYNRNYYDSSFAGDLDDVTIWKLDIVNGIIPTIFLGAASALSPQLATILCLPIDNDAGIGFGRAGVPDTRYNSLQVYNDTLYYRYATPSIGGVAKVATDGSASPVSIFEVANDYRDNLASISFSIDTEDEIGLAYMRWIDSKSSEFLFGSFEL